MAIGNTVRDFGNLPMGCGLPVGDATPQPIRGGKEYTDSQSNITTNIAMTLEDGWKPTYTYAIQATAPGYATPQDWIVLRGSASKTLKVTHIEVSGAITTAAGYIFTLKKHTIANTGGTSTNPAAIKHDSLDGAATGLILLYTVAPTTDGTAVIWKYNRIILQPPLNGAAGAVVTTPWIYDLGAQAYEAMTLRGVAQELAFNLGGVAIGTGQVYDFSITWTEE